MIKLQTDLVKLQADAPFIRFGRDSVLMAMARDSMVAHAYQEAHKQLAEICDSESPDHKLARLVQFDVESRAESLLKSWGVDP